MDPTIRSVIGYCLKAENSVAEIQLKTVDGTTVIIDVVPEAIGDLVLALMQARTEAILVDGAFEKTAGEDGMVMRHLFPAEKMFVVKEANPSMRRVQISTPGGAIFEFLVPADQMLQGTQVPRQR